MWKYDVYTSEGTWIDAVYYAHKTPEDIVKSDLIEHDGYPFDIVVVLVKKGIINES